MICIAEIIDFQRYVNSKEEEKKRIKFISILSNRCENINGILNSMSSCIGVSFVTKHFGEMNQMVGKEHIIDDGLYDVIVKALSDYEKALKNEIKELNEAK